ncbi:MAG: hypothetical protein Q9164_001707 [Protoblastenia rupestris]
MAVRNCYAEVKKALMNEKFDKIVLVLHSQGGLEGSMVVDWLLADVPNGLLNRLEVYTFACAANHFNNPLRSESGKQHILDSLKTSRNEQEERVIRHVEHYANSDDFVSKWGILSFARTEKYNNNRYAGRLFKRDGSGHQMNQHYLDTMFPLETPNGPVQEANDFMNTLVDAETDTAAKRERATVNTIAQRTLNLSNGSPLEHHTNGIQETDASTEYLKATKAYAARVQKKPVHELSRLWQYRNGASSKD